MDRGHRRHGGKPSRNKKDHRMIAAAADLQSGLVLPDRIELSTSSLPMKCSTTELRQRAGTDGGIREQITAGMAGSLP
jgi:hypothetical protein